MNFFVRPILWLLTLPLTLLTLGLFSLVVNGFTLLLTTWVTRSIHVDGLGTAILGALLISIINWFLGLGEKRTREA
jgi:putative membrane protein